ncbi:hypothetical protein P154DRAFT_561855 [Amniculicola lignicola CBS 123094]|uniref:Uncharacterized protein n=1 Tax=Amniculicola lignicola CBS 123094 TaxID=1392246 RepID=A0A6A5WR93_9PLEO|nr:hypothetical protein P154DRAFT_561855 [Amniculicola lignicola CBS 123094]
MVPMLPNPSSLAANNNPQLEQHNALRLDSLRRELPILHAPVKQETCSLPGFNEFINGGHPWSYPSPRSSISPCRSAASSPRLSHPNHVATPTTPMEHHAQLQDHPVSLRSPPSAQPHSRATRPGRVTKSRASSRVTARTALGVKKEPPNPKALRESKSRQEHCKSISKLQNVLLTLFPELIEGWTPLKSNNINKQVTDALAFNKKDVLDAASDKLQELAFRLSRLSIVRPTAAHL